VCVQFYISINECTGDSYFYALHSSHIIIELYPLDILSKLSASIGVCLCLICEPLSSHCFLSLINLAAH